ncbi:hypothetical protein H6G54_21190 [Anabaena cylindrica FACHB-243]|uniref:Uncharacterized protein n=1 Tax=Anabaena cylindrica (strain ATCC 27899 / PCC 7122) TaxID=272123 RepID=K9ZSH5_ANACC|nr:MULTISPECIES: hypothetical protein [Anabaena]AFZ61320.1 hypothetical protein Anacy_6043 [Anabaena cylindrica PCC 7122]MBD2420172.1 hypothetical protein [Anabaena cylindrica FACHB-243]MBY5282201.1 hypothetical protein [Anabaena sp. CCAP 1446/1C]MBY5309442.1 hypothetical protein [Anabaena sp. CCAP 1446/1C]MCM2409261.1 hypothetical protein [Anabaena sp. CCAP 1446/1C]
MLTQSPNDLDNILDSEETPLQGETVRYLTHIENKLYADIQARKRIDSSLLFLACQISSCSLSWLLFNLQVTLTIIQVASAVVSLLPGLIDVGDSFNFSISSDSWEFSLGNKPLIGIVKLAIGGAVSFSGTSKITSEIIQTKQAIAQTYQEIRSSDGLSFQLPDMGFSLLIALSSIALLGILKKVANPNNNQENNSND